MTVSRINVTKKKDDTATVQRKRLGLSGWSRKPMTHIEENWLWDLAKPLFHKECSMVLSVWVGSHTKRTPLFQYFIEWVNDTQTQERHLHGIKKRSERLKVLSVEASLLSASVEHLNIVFDIKEKFGGSLLISVKPTGALGREHDWDKKRGKYPSPGAE